ncbi:MAG: hypothetical protein V1776_01565 [Candidatus Diapherotrites archaeon]
MPTAVSPPRKRILLKNGLARSRISVRAYTKNNRPILSNPAGRFTAMKSLLQNESLSPGARKQLAERIILSAFEQPMLVNQGRINATVLARQTIGRTDPKLFRLAMDNLLRKGKIGTSGNNEFVRLQREKKVG